MEGDKIKNKTFWFKFSIVLLFLAAITLAILTLISCEEIPTEPTLDNAVIEAENKYFDELSSISYGINAVYDDFIISVEYYNSGLLTLRELKIDSIEFYSGIYTGVNAFNSLKGPIPKSLLGCNKYFSKYILEWQKAADHMKNFINSSSNKSMKSELQAALDCIQTSNGYIEAANAESNKLTTGETSVSQETSQEEKIAETKPTTIIKYNIIHTVNNARLDGGARYYLLTKPIDLSNSDFKEGIKGIVTRFVKIHGNKVSLNIYDKLETLENDYKETEDSNATVSTDPEYLKDIELHFIAYYDGDLSAGLYLNTLGFFPAYYEDIPEIEKYLEIIEFNP